MCVPPSCPEMNSSFLPQVLLVLREMEEVGCDLLVDVHGATLCYYPTAACWWKCTVRCSAVHSSCLRPPPCHQRLTRQNALLHHAARRADPCQQLVLSCGAKQSVQVQEMRSCRTSLWRATRWVQRLQASAVRVAGRHRAQRTGSAAGSCATHGHASPTQHHPPTAHAVTVSTCRASLAGVPAWPACTMPSATHSRPPHQTSRCDGRAID